MIKFRELTQRIGDACCIRCYHSLLHFVDYDVSGSVYKQRCCLLGSVHTWASAHKVVDSGYSSASGKH
jgi:hypothetical protein